eukprot:3989736-Pyramimonas_sp.AAC.1
MSYRAVWHSNRKELIRSTNLNYLNGRTRYATRDGTKIYAYSVNLSEMRMPFLMLLELLMSLELFGTAIGQHHQEREFEVSKCLRSVSYQSWAQKNVRTLQMFDEMMVVFSTLFELQAG